MDNRLHIKSVTPGDTEAPRRQGEDLGIWFRLLMFTHKHYWSTRMMAELGFDDKHLLNFLALNMDHQPVYLSTAPLKPLKVDHR